MPRIHAVVDSPVAKTFRVSQAAAMFDVSLSDRSVETFDVEVPGMDEPWQVGVIVGPSGCGKSTVARQAFGDAVVERFDWPRDAAILDGFDQSADTKQIVAMLGAVGFSSPPAWVRPYHVLSGGQRMRCDLARALLSNSDVVAFDEFTSVVDRTVAKVASLCVSKAVRREQARCRRFVAVTCHYDVLEWLEPDWVLDMAAGKLARGRVQRGERFSLDIREGGRELWPVFARHHYLSHALHRGAKCYIATVSGEPAGFCASMQAMGFKGMRRIHRLVVLPDFQGLGIGGRLLDAVAGHEAETARVRIRTSHPSLIRSLKKRPSWRAANVSKGVNVAHSGTLGRKSGKLVGSEGRVTVSFEFRRNVAKTKAAA